MRNFRISLGAIIVLLASVTVGFAAERPKLPASTLPVPLVNQETDYSCGAAALLSVLQYWKDFGGDEESLYEPLGTTPKDGTHPRALERVARQFGLQAELREGLTLKDLRGFLAARQTAIVDIQAWADEDDGATWEERWEDGHYVILIAMDKRYLYFMDPSTEDAYAYIAVKEFEQRWHDYETEDGKRREYRRMAVIVQGARAEYSELETRSLRRLR